MISDMGSALRRVVGCMSGTSCDGIDAVLVGFDGGTPMIMRGIESPLGGLGETLRALMLGEPANAGMIVGLGRELALAHVAVIKELLAGAAADLVVVHGQTVFHAPPRSWQLVDLPLIAHRLRLPVLGDLRAADLAAGGQGAPITPIADVVLFPGSGARAVVNIGGFVNATWLHGLKVMAARDLCSGNHLLDEAARRCLDRPYDDGGLVAASGKPDPSAVAALTSALTQQDQGQSLGSGDEMQPWVEYWAQQLSPADCLASAVNALAEVISAAIAAESPAPTEVWIAGGGARNRALMAALVRSGMRRRMRVKPADDAGVPAQWREAAAMAILGERCWRRQPITLPAVTGCSDPAPIAGTWVFPNGLP